MYQQPYQPAANPQYQQLPMFETKPTWGLAWDLFWRMALLQIALLSPIYAIIFWASI